MEGGLMSERLGTLLVILFYGIVLSNVVVASSATFGAYAPLQLNSTWLLMVSLASGLILGLVVRDNAAAILYGVLLIAMVAVLGFAGTLLAVTLMSGSRLVDIVLLSAIQQAFPRVIALSVLGYAGAFSAGVFRLVSGRLWRIEELF
jgi:hypothetical protein